MKPISLFLPVFVVCILFVFVLPHLARVPSLRSDFLPVSVTSYDPSTLAGAAPLTALGQVDAPSMLGEKVISIGMEAFIASLQNGRSDQIVGVFAPGQFALPVRQQPNGQPDYVDRDNNVLTEFSLPRKYGSTGLLAHNYLSGSRFFQLRENMDVHLIYGDGRTETYRISDIVSFQALNPTSPFSNFVDVSDPTRSVLSSAELFNRVYTTDQQLVFQTCIEAYGEPSWGRMFIIARLVEPLSLTVPAAPAPHFN